MENKLKCPKCEVIYDKILIKEISKDKYMCPNEICDGYLEVQT